METKIIIQNNWQTIKTYPFVFTMSKNDQVELKEKYYKVINCYLDLDKNEMLIIIKKL
jgi:hypothetical protein